MSSRNIRVRLRAGAARARAAFSLVELMVVVMILGMLATVVAINVQGYLARSRQEKAKMDIAALKDAVMLFFTSEGRHPTNEEGLAILKQGTASNPTGIISSLPLDPWGRQYEYVFPGLHGDFDIVSYGMDGTEGGDGEDADICSWELDKK